MEEHCEVVEEGELGEERQELGKRACWVKRMEELMVKEERRN